MFIFYSLVSVYLFKLVYLMESKMSEQTLTPNSKPIPKRSYQPPLLKELGDMRGRTLGTSPGGGDSNDPGTLEG